MSPSTGTRSVPSRGIDGRIINNVVVSTYWIDPSGNAVQTKEIAGLPSDVMVRTRRVATDANCTHQRAVLVKSQATSEHVYSANLSTTHWIIGLPIMLGVSAVSDVRIDRIAMLQAKQASARLDGGKEIGR